MQFPRSSPSAAVPSSISVRLYALILTMLILVLVCIDVLLPDVDRAQATTLPVPRGVILTDDRGFPLSTNPVWNLCVRGSPVPVGVLRRNTDTVTHRRGRVRVSIPKSCDQYRIGSTHIWKHPDFLDAELYLSGEGKLLGVLTEGYVAKRFEAQDQTVRAK
jgi:hypothetical protein